MLVSLLVSSLHITKLHKKKQPLQYFQRVLYSHSKELRLNPQELYEFITDLAYT